MSPAFMSPAFRHTASASQRGFIIIAVLWI